MNFNKPKQINWRVYERDHIYPQVISAYLDLMKFKPSVRYPYIANYYEVISFIDDYFWWARDTDLLEKAFRRWLKEWLTQTKKLKAISDLYKNSHRELNQIIPKLRKVKINKITNQQLYDLYLKAKAIFVNNVSFSEYATDLFDDFFGKIFGQNLQKLSNNQLTESELSQIMQPAYVSQSLLYKKELLKFSFSKNVPLKKLELLVKKFYWVMMSWDGSNELTLGHVKKDLADLRKKSFASRQKELEGINNFLLNTKKERNRILKKYNLSAKNLARYFHLLDTFTLFHDLRKESQMRCNQIIFSALREIAKRFKINYNDLIFYYNEEVEDLCLRNKKLADSVIKTRKQGLTFVISKGQVKEFTVKKAKLILNQLVLSVVKAKQVKLVKGIPASQGKAKGPAFVVKGAEEAKRVIKKGGILVTSMTSIDYLPAMRKAGAIITDDGGITCHAAIISRELGIPCVVGTKVATQVFKTGDKIEVDANKGVVRKI